MSKKELDIIYFLSFCIEQYKVHIGKNGQDTAKLLADNGVLSYLAECYEPLHTQSRQWIIEEIDDFIKRRKEGKR